MTRSFARAERLLSREYHGRFLIELLQNAADASRGADTLSGRSRLVVQITEGPALLVANEGTPMSAEVVIESLGHIGASMKAEGEAIGHKGIGFKSVLEVTSTPEIYSGLQQPSPALAVGFDPERALERIRGDGREAWVAKVQRLDQKDPFAAVPVLRFPHWIEELPAAVADLKERRFDTVVRLPFDGRFAGRLGLGAEAWLETVRAALRDVSDQILLLLGCFYEVRFEDHLDRSEEVITPEWQEASVPIGNGMSREVVRVQRNHRLSSRWRLFRRTLPDRAGLAGEVAVGIRVDDGASVETVLPAIEDEPSTPFHLFFPTRILSGLPFLLHAYFEVDAARTGFYRGSVERNEAMLAGLAELVTVAVADAAEREVVDLVSLANRVAEAGEPEDPLARKFRSDVLDLLDDVPWIPLQDGGEGPRSARPAGVLGARPELIRRIGGTFPASYIGCQTGLGLPDNGLSDAAIGLVTARASDAPGLWDTIGLLCRPGENPPWEGLSADPGFRSLIDLLAALDVEDRNATRELLDSLRVDPRSRLIPTVGAESDRILLRVPDPSEGTPGRRSRLVMARVRSAEGRRPLIPPADLDVAFLPDGLLSSEAELDRAKPLGVRPFTVDNVLDRLSGIDGARVDGDALVRFLWQLLARDGVSGFSMRRSVERASVFDPSEWFWCRPGRAREDETARLRQRRERYLAAVPLPCRDGKWRQAGRIAFGADWADWLEERADGRPAAAAKERIAAYRAMERLSPGPADLLAPPERVLGLLEGDVFYEGGLETDDAETTEVPDEGQRDARRHAFLLRLGVWEVPPIEAFEGRDPRNRSNFPWTGPVADKQREEVERAGGWQFGLGGWAGRRHHNVYLAEDYRFLWPLEEMAERDVSALVTGLRLGVKLYGQRANALFFCPGCGDGGGSHRAGRHSTGADGYPSSLAIELRGDPWVPCTLDGAPLEDPLTPASAWWHPKPPSGAALRQSPWRMVPLCGPPEGMTEDLRRLAGVQTLDEAQADVLEALLLGLRGRFEDGRLPVDPLTSDSARQAFAGLHRLAYERLSELASGQSDAAAGLGRTGVLCEFGEGLVYRPPADARHDDGRFSTYVRHFFGRIPFVALPRDRESVASRLGIAPFRLRLTRRGSDEGRDVTDDVRGFHGDRIAELLSIMVHHSLGTQTLDATSEQFEERARRIRNLRIVQLDDLIVDAVDEGSAHRVTIGTGSTQDLFLEEKVPSSPVLFHDLSGEGWPDRLRRKIAPYLARVLGNQAYAHTFAVFLQGDDTEREEFLLELGITADEVDAIRTRIGIVGEEERRRHRRWFLSILKLLGAQTLGPDLGSEDLASRLIGTGRLPTEVAERLVELGGGESVRREAGQDSALRMLAEAGVDLRALHSELIEAGDRGLYVRVAQRAFDRWMDTNGRRLSAVLATKLPAEEAKTTVRSLGSSEPPADLMLSIDPALPALLSPVVGALQQARLDPNAHDLAHSPEPELVRLGGFGTVEALDSSVTRLFHKEEHVRFLHARAAQWQREIRLLAVLARTGPAETRSTIHGHYESVTAILPLNPSSPADLRDVLAELFSEHPALARRISAQLVATVNASAPDRKQLMTWAEQDGVAVDRLAAVERALGTGVPERTRALRKRSQQLLNRGVRPVRLAFLPIGGSIEGEHEDDEGGGEGGGGGGGGTLPDGPINVGPGHVPDSLHEFGDEGERWALAAVVDALVRLPDEARGAAIDQIKSLLGRFRGTSVAKAIAHAEPARMRGLDDQERIDELASLLHVSQYSDSFGFDMIGWLPTDSSGEGQALCLEVKSSGGEGFHLSRRQWSVAEWFHSKGMGDQYAVLVVRRAKGGGVPDRMDLLSNPVALKKKNYLRMKPDGYEIAYRTSGS